MAVRLVSLGDGPPIQLDRPIVFIGRHPECDVCIDSRKISRRHCCIAQLEDKLILRDLGSTNGVQHNGRRVQEATLAPKDEITIADLEYQVVVENNGAKNGPDPGDAEDQSASGSDELET